MTQISAFNPVEAAVRGSPSSRFNELKSEDFIKIIFTELSNQDPFAPNDSAALLEQLDSIRSIESDIELGRRLDSLVFENQLAAASAMIGKFVGGLTAENDRVAGYVVSVLRQGDSVQVELDNGWLIPVGNIEAIIDPPQTPNP
jgi:flagellar basal-body rod modification protein FlgD